MLYRQINASQVKCNFCLDWMSLSIDVKSNINICDICLSKGQDNTLKAVSSKGEIYQLYIVRQNSVIDLPKQSKTIVNWFQNHQKDKFQENSDVNKKNQLLEEIDHARNLEFKEIMAKWQILWSFLNNKNSLSEEQIKFIKNIISQRTMKFQGPRTQQIIESVTSKSQNLGTPFDFQIQQQQVNFDEQKKISFTYSQNQFHQVNIKVQDKQNIPVKTKKSRENKQNGSKHIERLVYNSPFKFALKQKDLNCLHISHVKLSDLKENNFTPGKRLKTSLGIADVNLYSSCIKSSLYNQLNSSRSSLKGSLWNSMTKPVNSQQHKKFEQTKKNIAKYLQKHYDSQSLARLMFSLVLQAYKSTSVVGKSLQLVSFNLSYTDFRCYLEAFEWTGIEILKLVKTKLCDDQLKILLNFIIFNKLQIKVLVLTSNRLTEVSIEHMHDQELSSVKQIYLGKNRVMKGKVRSKINSLQNKYSLYM